MSTKNGTDASNFYFYSCDVRSVGATDGGGNNEGQFILPNQELPKLYIDRIRQPISHMKETEIYHKILDDVKQKQTIILHCCGIPGSGKSQVIRKLAVGFPYQENMPKLYIRWHIQCNDSGHDLKEELKKLVEELRKNSYLPTDETYRTVIGDLDKNFPLSFINALNNCNVPVLIIIEDPTQISKELLSDLIRCLKQRNESAASEQEQHYIHVYITSRGKSVILSEDEISSIECYKTVNVQGFTKEEAISFLKYGSQDVNEPAAVNVFKRFSGLPLGLQAAKMFCKSARIDYKTYLRLIKKSEFEIQKSEKQAILREYGENAEHIFSAIVMLFMQNPHSDIDLVYMKVLTCLSYLHYDRIPSEVIERCCRELEPSLVSPETTMVKKGQLIYNLLEHGMCTETDRFEITFHEVVMNAFRLNNNATLGMDQFKPLRKSVEILSGLLSKDMRKKENSIRMYQLRRHAQALLDHVKKDQLFFKCDELLLLKALVSHLYETAAAIMLAESPSFGSTSDEYFLKALQSIWGSKETDYLVNGYKTDLQCEEVAKQVVKRSLDKADELPSNFIQEYISKQVMYIDDNEIDFLELKSSSEDFNKVREELENSTGNDNLITELRNCGVFLPEKLHQKIFYVEKVASILHSWSRVVLYADNKTDNNVKKCIWFSSLARQISIECRIQCNVALLSEKLSTNGGLIPILLIQKQHPEKLTEAKKLCEDALSQNSEEFEMFENGLLKEVYGPSHLSTRILLLRYLVSIYSRLFASSKLNEVDVSHADGKCRELLQLASENLENISNGRICVIRCAKYHAAKKDFNEALNCSNVYLDAVSKSESRFNVHAWAIYNYARIVSRGELLTETNKALAECRKVLDSPNVVGADLRRRLLDTVSSLESQLM